MVVFILVLLQLLSQCLQTNGSHYVKIQMSDYCDRDHMPLPIMLTPNSNMTAILLKLKRETYRPGMNCKITFQAPPNYGLMAFITKIKLRRISHNRADKLEFISHNITLLRMHGVNQEVVPRKTILTGLDRNVLDIHFMSEQSQLTLAGKGFKIVVNLYTNVMPNNECNGTLPIDFNCGNICIDSLLECDGINNCRNNEDELECDETSETKLSLYVFLITLVVMVILIMMFMMKNKEKRKEIVRRMSRVYANNNPILFVMESNQELDSPPSSNTTTSVPTPENQVRHEQFPIQKPPELQRFHSVRSKLSLSLPQGIDQLSLK